MQFRKTLNRILSGVFSRLSSLTDNLRYQKYSFYIDSYDIEPKANFFKGSDTYVYGEGKFSVKQGSYCGARCGIYVDQNSAVLIGANTALSHNVRIYTSNRNADDVIHGMTPVTVKVGSVSIGDNCWIGANVFICEGVSIGDNVVVGANSVVSKDIQSNSIAVGAPIRVIKASVRKVNKW
ncbi:hypothetical protein AHAT_00310 [Agarivorans sp. Toyoura001]|uniref:acyltransferase n=1 Tax=Agarivorans sp. Toyoura001 TaxID=2283141 RepID=UPI0010EB8C9A|nr:acyltransferase [Agarivorans sp. Toyoura001]GDY24141.1 hypothetical protein AHAT_00310 [Agarivorans sp. Toyoura001]